MCGIAGFIDDQLTLEENKGYLVNMLRAIEHRGPDGSGIYTDGPVYLGHQRLAIIDLSSKGHQPKESNSGRYICSFNGEIYNYKELRFELEKKGYIFNSSTDTEVLLTLIDHLGLEDALKQCVGMFAIALWDRELEVLSLARDRFGEKPLYYGWHKGKFIFGSELKSLIEHPSFEKKLCNQALDSYFKYNYIETPFSIFENTKKLGSGEILSLNIKQGLKENSEEVTKYWSLEGTFLNGLENNFTGNYSDARNKLQEHLKDSVKQQMQADVPLGAMLSGGIDSSLIVALMQENSINKVNTFSIGFLDKNLDEAKYSKEIASHLGTNHHELYVTENEVQSAALEMSSIFDEPFSDSSQVPTFLVSKLAKERVTVSLSGDGGDELFFGYSKYITALKISQLPQKELLSKVIKIISSLPHLDISKLLKLKQSLQFLSLLLNSSDFSKLYQLLSSDRFYDKLVNQTYQRSESEDLHKEISNYMHSSFMYLDTKKYLADDILVKVDRASMAVSLENRVPFLDHRILEFSSTLPFEFLYSKNQQKRLLRDIAYGYIPKNLLNRPKSGFVPPISNWLKSDLKDWSIDLLSNAGDEFIDIEYSRKIFEEHIRGKRDHSISLWKILMFLDWKRRWL